MRLLTVLDSNRTGPEKAREIITVLDSYRTGPEQAREISNCTRFQQDRA